MDFFGDGDHPLHVLFVCTANVDRSKTAEDLYKNDPRLVVKSCGVAPFAQVVVTRDLLDWADRIFVRAAATNDSMPPGPDDPPQAERDDLAEWLACTYGE